MKNVPLLIGTIVGTLVLIFGIAFFFSEKTEQQVATTVVDQSQLLADATKISGPENAPITIVEFSDFQCPACRATQSLLKQLMNEKGDKVRIVFRHFPLNDIHPNAQLAAQASEAALSLNAFTDYHYVLFEKQDEWAQKTDKKELLELFGTYAENLKLDKRQFLERIESQTSIQAVKKDQELGTSVNVEATPTFFVNGQKTAAPQLFATVESLLAQKNESN